MDDAFKVLQQKDIYELLEGSSDFEIVASDGNRYGMPYLTAWIYRCGETACPEDWKPQVRA